MPRATGTTVLRALMILNFTGILWDYRHTLCNGHKLTAKIICLCLNNPVLVPLAFTLFYLIRTSQVFNL